jgi:exopolysaccharide biosynthesis polyprenyl glycosylphosphotransferase
VLKRHHQLVRAAIILVDALATALACIAAYAIRFHSSLIPSRGDHDPDAYLAALPLVVLLSLLAYRWNGLYEPRRIESFGREIGDVVRATLAALLMTIAATFFLRSVAESRAVLVLFGALNPVLLVSLRGLARRGLWALRRRGFNRRYAIVVGTGKLGQRVADKIARSPWTGLTIVGFVEALDRKRESVRGIPVIGRVDDISSILAGRDVDHVFVALPSEHARTIRRVADLLSREAIAVTLVPDILDFVTLNASAADFDGLPVIHLRDHPIDDFGLALKRALDVVVALVGMLVAAPVMAVVAFLVWKADGFPILYAQERMGLDGRSFRMLKFRSMRRDAESGTGAVWATKDDPRVTPIGRWIRKLSLDELPQLWNVLKGEMSIVGPRPERPVLIEDFKRRIPRYMLRHATKAGLTGWAQVNGWRGDTSLKKRLQYDLYYIENWSLLFDVKIILLTFLRGFYHKNAY